MTCINELHFDTTSSFFDIIPMADVIIILVDDLGSRSLTSPKLVENTFQFSHS